MTEHWKSYGKQVVTKTPEEWAVEATAGELWECRRCGCKDSRVIDSRFNGTERRRIRVCRNCSTPMPVTVEIPVPKGFRVELVPECEPT